ncbi:MAG: hypothetical protein HY749_15870 [Gammaproteobacteria bacterium]|nr:hypothetical protein [Gammaproteobacteria bacterium]
MSSATATVVHLAEPLRQVAVQRLAAMRREFEDLCAGGGLRPKQTLHEALERWAEAWATWSRHVAWSFVVKAEVSEADGEVLREMLMAIWTKATRGLYAKVAASEPPA